MGRVIKWLFAGVFTKFDCIRNKVFCVVLLTLYLKAADQGHYEGAELLKTCFETNRIKHITENNSHKIRSFLEYVTNVNIHF